MTDRVREYMRFSSDHPDASALRRLRKEAMRIKPTPPTKRSVSSKEKGTHTNKKPKLTDADSPPMDVNLTVPHPYESEFDRLVATSRIETTLPAKSQSSSTVVVDKSPTKERSARYDELYYGLGEKDVDYEEELTSSSEDNLGRNIRGVSTRASPMHSREHADRSNTPDVTQLVTDRKVLQTTSVEKYTL